MAKFAINVSGAMLLPSLVQVSESISGSVVPLAMFHIHAALTFLARSTHTCGQLYIFEYLVFPAYQLSELFGLKSWNI